MNKNLQEVVNTISNWNAIKEDKKKVLSLLGKTTSFKLQLPVKSKCERKFHIYFGIIKNKTTHEDAIIMHVISDFNDQPDWLRKIENTQDYIFSVILDTQLADPYEIDEQEAKTRKAAWHNLDIVERWIHSNELFDVFVVAKDNFLPDHIYTAHFGMKCNTEQNNSFTPDIIIQNDSNEYNTYFYDLARLCPPYGRLETFGLQDLSS